MPEHIGEEPPTATRQPQQCPSGVVVVAIDLEVLREGRNTLRQHCYLHIRRASVALFKSKLTDQLFLLLRLQHDGAL